MTDDKAESGGPSSGSCGNPLCEMCNYNRGYADGLKAERERCLRILRSHPEKCEGIVLGDCLNTVIELIGGGQDAK